MSIRDGIKTSLKILGWKEVELISKKYHAMVHTKAKEAIFLGSHGAIRAGRAPSKSWSMEKFGGDLMRIHHYLTGDK